MEKNMNNILSGKEESLEEIQFPSAVMPDERQIESVIGEELKAKESGRVKMVDPRKLVEEENFNVRLDYDLDELKASIKENGVKNPVSVWFDNSSKQYTLIDGHRRFRSVMELISEGVKIKGIPVISESKKPDIGQRTLDLINMNSSKPLSPVEKGIVCRRMVNYGYSQKEIAKLLGYTQGRVSQLIKLGSYPKKVQNAINGGVIAAHEVDKLATLDEFKSDPDKLTEAVDEANKNKKGKKAKASDTKAGKKVKQEKDVEETVSSLVKRFKPMAQKDELPGNKYLEFMVDVLELIASGNDSDNNIIELVTEYAKFDMQMDDDVETESKQEVDEETEELIWTNI